MATASQVPNVYDVIINGEGYLLADAEEQKAGLSYSPVFIPRQNTRGDFGDADQDFFHTYTAKDWSGGEQLKFARPNDEQERSRYWRGENVDVTVSGQVNLRPLTTQTSAFGAAVTELAGRGSAIYATGTTNLYSLIPNGTITDHGAHGLGTAPKSIVVGNLNPDFDGPSSSSDIYMSSNASSTVGVRRWNGAAFSTFSATGADSLAYLNNTLYGVAWNTATAVDGRLFRYDTAGTSTTLYTWQSPNGTRSPAEGKIAAFGGKLLILRHIGPTGDGSELWLYDGTAPAIVAALDAGFVANDLAVVGGVAFIGGYFKKYFSSSDYRKPAVFFYANGSLGKLWEAESFVASTSAREPRLAAYQGGLVFTDDTRGSFMFYDPHKDGISTIGTYTFTNQTPRIAASGSLMLHSRAATQPYRLSADGFSTSGYIATPLVDFDTSLTKLFRGVTVEWDDDPSDTGATVDIAYRTNDLDGSYTTLQTTAVSGTEYTLASVTGKSISVKVTLNKSNSTAGPTLKRIKVRAAPSQPSYRKRTYRLALRGKDGKGNLVLRNGSSHPKDGVAMLANLETAATSQTPISVTDIRGTMSTCVVEDLNVIAVAPQEFVAEVKVREV